MEETMVSPLLYSAMNFLALGLSVVLLFAVAYLWSSNSNKSAEIARIQTELNRVKKNLTTLETKVSQLREPRIVSDVPPVEPFGIDLSVDDDDDYFSRPITKMSPLSPQEPWINFVADYNKLSTEMAKPGQLKRCEKFIHDNKLKTLTYGGAMTFRPAIDVKDSGYWAFKCSGDEFAVVPNPMNPCDEDLHEHGGLKEIFALNYQSGVYRKYSVKLPAIFTQDPLKGWQLKNPGVVNLERN